MLNAGGEDDLGASFAKAALDVVDELIKGGGGLEDDLHHLGVIAGHTVAFDHIGNRFYIGVEILFLVGFELNLNKGLNVIVEFFKVNCGVIPSDNSSFFKLVDSGGNGRRGDEAGC